MISELLQKFKSLDTDKAINDGFTDTLPDFENANRKQMKAGKTIDGSPIRNKDGGGYRSKSYARLKNAMNPLPTLGTPDLFLTGEFSRQLDAELYGETIDIISKDDKSPELEDKYPDIFGIGTNYKKEYQDEHLAPAVIGKIAKFVGLKFSNA
jgi:hypothetical protein